MALVNGSDYDHIDLHSVDGGDVTRHMLKDAHARQDVSDLKSAIDNNAKLVLVATDASFSTLNIGRYRNFETNGITYVAWAASSGSLNTSNKKAVTFTNPVYDFGVLAYSSTTVTDAANLIIGSGWLPAGAIWTPPPETKALVVQVKRTDEGTIADSEAATIKAGFVFYVPTDKSLSEEWKAADAKAVGDALQGIDASVSDIEGKLPVVENGQIFIPADDARIEAATAASLGTLRQLTSENERRSIVLSDAAASSTLTLGKYRDFETNTITTDASTAYSGSINTQKRRYVYFSDAAYLFGVNAYSTTTTSGTESFLGGSGWLEPGTIWAAPENAAALICQVKRIDGAAITSAEVDTIKAAFTFYMPTDKSLSAEWKAADAKATGEAIQATQSMINAVGLIAYDFYQADDSVELVATYDGVIALFDTLVSEHGGYITKNTLTNGTFANYEYVLSIGNYNTAGKRSRDAVITRPKVLITSGVHGYERSSVMSLYTFVKALCENAYSLSDVIDFPEYHIIPIVCPWGYTNNSRINENGVNINRNFDTSDWTQTSTGTDYSGAAPGDQPETQLVQSWLSSNNDAVVYIDWHNSNFTNEISCMLGKSDAESMEIKKDYLGGINHAIPYWQIKRNITTTNIYGYTGTSSTPGTGKTYGSEQGIPSFTFETSWNVIESGKHSAFSIGTGAEAFGNMIKGIRSLFV